MAHNQEIPGYGDRSLGESTRGGNGAGNSEFGAQPGTAGSSRYSGSPGIGGTEADTQGSFDRGAGMSGSGNDRPGINWRDGATQTKQTLATAKDRLADTVIAAQDRSSAMLETTCGYIQRYPFRSVAIAGAVGLVVGVLLGSRNTTQQLLGYRLPHRLPF